MEPLSPPPLLSSPPAWKQVRKGERGEGEMSWSRVNNKTG